MLGGMRQDHPRQSGREPLVFLSSMPAIDDFVNLVSTKAFREKVLLSESDKFRALRLIDWMILPSSLSMVGRGGRCSLHSVTILDFIYFDGVVFAQSDSGTLLVTFSFLP